MPVVKLLVCDDAPQFKPITDELALCWVHDGRRYKKLDPFVSIHREKSEAFRKDYWKFYGQLVKTPNNLNPRDRKV